MHRKFVLIAFMFAVFPRNTISQDSDELLTEDDISLEFSRQKGTPALSAPLHEPEYWESNNQWMCFDSKSVELMQVRAETEFGNSMIPVIIASLPGYFLEISIFGEGKVEDEAIFTRWKQLFEGSQGICTYAAYLDDVASSNDKPGSTWIINKLKTENGYWTYGETESLPQTVTEAGPIYPDE